MQSTRLILKQFSLGQKVPGGPFVELHGRAPGLTAFLLNLIGLDPTTSMICYPDRVEVIQAGFTGRESVVIPLNKVTAIVGGHARPLAPLVLLAYSFFQCLISGVGTLLTHDSTPLLMAFGFGAFLAIMAIIAYLLGRSMTLAVQNGGDQSYGLKFGQGVIEGVEVNPQRVQQAVEMLNQAVMAATSR